MAGSPGPIPISDTTEPDVKKNWVLRNDKRIELAAIGLAVVIAFLLRWVILLRGGGYPPSEDAAGDLYNARLWLTGTFQGSENALLYPPVYYFMVVIPLTSITPPLSAVEVMMALVPAVLILPAHQLLKRAKVLWPVSLVTAFALAMSSAYSNMVTWNSAYNMFAIVLMVGFFYSLLLYLDEPTRRHTIFAAVLFSLVIGSHELTAVVMIETTILFLIFLAGVAAYKRRLVTTLRNYVRLAPWCVLLTIPWWPIYLYSYVHTTNVGYSPGLVNWSSYLMATVSQAWSGASPNFELVGEIVSLISIFALTAMFRKYFRLLLLFLALFLASISVSLLDSQNAVRGLPFLPIIFVLAIAPPISDAVRWLASSQARHPDARIGTLSFRRRLQKRSPKVTTALRFSMAATCVFALLLFSYANVVNSEEYFQSSAVFFSEVNQNNIAVMQWLESHAPDGSTVYVPSPTLGWARYYDPGLNVIGPYQLQLNVITNGLRTTEASNDIYMGAYNIGSNYISVSTNYQGPGTPSLWIGTPGNNLLFGMSTATQASVTVAGSHGLQTLNISTARLINATGHPPSDVAPGVMTLLWHWPTQNITMVENFSLQSQTLDIAWSSGTPGVWTTGASFVFSLPHSNMIYHYVNVNPSKNVSTLQDTFSYTLGYNVVVPFELQITPANGRVSQASNPAGLTVINSTFEGDLQVQFRGLVSSSDGTSLAFSNATKLLKELNVSYVIVDSVSNYAFYSLFTSLDATGYTRATVVDQSGSWYAFHLTYD